MSDNLDLQIRRKRLRLTQRDVAECLGLKRLGDVSEFELGRRDKFPNGKGRKDYEKALTILARKRGVAA